MESVINIARPVIGSQAAAGRHDKRTRQSAMSGISNNDGVQRKLKTSETAQIAYTVAAGSKPVQQQKLLVIEHGLDPPGRYTSAFDDFELLFAGDRDTALAKLIEHKPAVILLDQGPAMNTVETPACAALLESILDLAPDTKVIVITPAGDRETAASAIRLGAYDYSEQPVDSDLLEFIIKRAFDRHALEALSRNQHISVDHDEYQYGIITKCPEMRHVCRAIEKAAPTPATVLLLGESGTGKELLAQALHTQSLRIKAPFVAINCAAIPADLLESELFGYEKGAFTGATSQVIGKIERANYGTLFLDEIGDLTLNLQAKLLRFLEERTFHRIGGHDEIKVDIRIVCATHQNIVELIDKNLFREDLYYRISEITVKVPALRERPGDAIVLAREFLRESSRTNGKSVRNFSNEALSAIDAFDWPGNVRELKNCVNRAVIMTDDNRIEASDLAIPSRQHDTPLMNLSTPLMNLRQIRESTDRETLIKAFLMADGNVSRVAEILGTSRTTIYDLAAKYGLK